MTNIAMETKGIPEAYVPLDYNPDGAIETLVRGSSIENGMIVLSEDMREDPERHVEGYNGDYKPSVYDRLRLNKMSRWCRVTELTVQNDIVSFVGIYADGSMYSRSYHQRWYWLVKR